MKVYEWEKECLSLQEGGAYTYKQLADKFNTSVSVVTMVLHRQRHPGFKKKNYYRCKAGERCWDLMLRRQIEVNKILKTTFTNRRFHRDVLEAYAAGLNSRECGEVAGCSYTWANIILKGYGLETHDRITTITREWVLDADRRGTGISLSKKRKSNSKGMGKAGRPKRLPSRPPRNSNPENSE